ncbi:MAG: protein-L-isoaspartate O-methyltransferase, partial [Akkermansiaceae bacterium]|nr:protein-L-isoaspartate O-methyltransferase [Akkermansiaceae bacterium]
MFRRQDGDADLTLARERMVAAHLVGRGITDRRVVEAMRQIPRHEFVPAGLRARAYDDGPLPIGGGQTISQPYIVALMTELLELTGGERVLEVGAGCGYQTAILSALAGEVCAVELDPALCETARGHLARIGAANVDLRCASGFEPWPGGGTFDAILSACAPGA